MTAWCITIRKFGKIFVSKVTGLFAESWQIVVTLHKNFLDL